MKKKEATPSKVTAMAGQQNTYVEITMSNGLAHRYVLSECKNTPKEVELAFVRVLDQKVPTHLVIEALKANGLIFKQFSTEV